MIIQVKVIANASEDRVLGLEHEILRVKCRATPEKGKANAAIIELLALYYKVPKSAIKIVWGKTSSRKLIEVDLP